VPAKRSLDIVKRITDLGGQLFASNTVDNVLVLARGKFGASTQGLP